MENLKEEEVEKIKQLVNDYEIIVNKYQTEVDNFIQKKEISLELVKKMYKLQNDCKNLSCTIENTRPFELAKFEDIPDNDLYVDELDETLDKYYESCDKLSKNAYSFNMYCQMFGYNVQLQVVKKIDNFENKMQATDKEIDDFRKELKTHNSNFLTIIALLISLVSIIFGNVVNKEAPLKVVLVSNLSILSAVTLIFIFVRCVINVNEKVDKQKEDKGTKNSFIGASITLLVMLFLALILIAIFMK